MGKVHSVFGIDGYGGDSVALMTPELEELVKNDFDVEKFRSSLQEHQTHEVALHREMVASVESIEEFNGVIKRVKERSKGLKPLNRGLVRALKFGQGRFFGLLNVGGFFTKSLSGYRTEDLVAKYCEFFEEHASDFGQLFCHVVEREGRLTDYSNELIRRNQFYVSTQGALDEMVERRASERDVVLRGIEGSSEISRMARSALIDRAKWRYEGAADSRKIADILIQENERAMEEVGGLIEWCGGMKNVLALGKERMDNYCRHLEETMVAYLQAISINRCFRDTNNAVSGMASVMLSAQASADEGIKNIVEFVKHNGLYGKPINFRGLL